MSEICICAAIVTKEGEIIRGHRHADAMATAIKKNLRPSSLEDTQGFMTSMNRFVSRREAGWLQKAAGIPSVDPRRGQFPDVLFSEDLY